MLYIKEILKEKKLTQNELADILNISRQALSRQIQGKMLVDTANRIASALDVPLWRLFASPEEIESNKQDFTALISFKNNLYKADSIKELKHIISEIETLMKNTI